MKLIFGKDDKHLYFRSRFFYRSRAGITERQLTISTDVKFNNWFGQLYFLPVKPFHLFIVPAMPGSGLQFSRKITLSDHSGCLPMYLLATDGGNKYLAFFCFQRKYYLKNFYMNNTDTKIILTGGTVVALTALLALNACKTIPKGAVAVKPFDAKQYSGKWYEIARLDFKYERNLNNTTATYSLNDNGSIKVVNRGFNIKAKEQKEAIGKAKFVDSADEGKLKVSFFGPFYSGYNVIALDPEYKYALVAGESLKYLWLLSRETTMPENIKQDYLKKAKEIGYHTDDLVWVEHNQ